MNGLEHLSNDDLRIALTQPHFGEPMRAKIRAEFERRERAARPVVGISPDDGFVRAEPRTDELEKVVQRAIVEEFQALGWDVTSTSQAQRAQMTPGIPDLYCRNVAQQRRVWAEVKRPDLRGKKHGGLGKEQREWHAAERAAGGEVYVVYGIEDVRRIHAMHLKSETGVV